MIAVVTILSAFALGYFMRSRLAANTAYAAMYLWAFTYQTLYLMLDSLDRGAEPAFTTDEFPWAYGAVALAIFLVGFGLVAFGHRVGAKRRSARSARVGAVA
jgi:hypothetical protein